MWFFLTADVYVVKLQLKVEWPMVMPTILQFLSGFRSHNWSKSRQCALLPGSQTIGAFETLSLFERNFSGFFPGSQNELAFNPAAGVGEIVQVQWDGDLPQKDTQTRLFLTSSLFQSIWPHKKCSCTQKETTSCHQKSDKQPNLNAALLSGIWKWLWRKQFDCFYVYSCTTRATKLGCICAQSAQKLVGEYTDEEEQNISNHRMITVWRIIPTCEIDRIMFLFLPKWPEARSAAEEIVSDRHWLRKLTWCRMQQMMC